MRTWTPESRIIAGAPGVLVALLGTVAIAGVRQGLTPMLGSDMALSFFLIVVSAAAAVGGLGTGLLAMAVALFVSLQPAMGLDQLVATPADWVRVVAFLVEGTTISVLFKLLQRRNAHVSAVLADLHAQQRLVERMALEDSLTGLGNLRALRRDIAAHVALALRDGSMFTVVCADVDGLKATNDRYGHSRGDELLSGMARLLAENCRSSDAAYRIGGDEFVVLLPVTGPSGYESWKERFEVLSAAMRRDFDDAGLSLGAAHLSLDGDSADALLSVADQRMYAAKIATAHPRVATLRGRTPAVVVSASARSAAIPARRDRETTNAVLSDVLL